MIDVIDIIVYHNALSLRWPGGRVVMQRFAKPCTSVQFRSGPPSHALLSVISNPALLSDTYRQTVKSLRNKNPQQISGYFIPSLRSTILSRFVANCLMCITAIVWGATFIAQKTGMETIGPMGFTFGRYLIGAGVIIPLALYEARKVNLLKL